MSHKVTLRSYGYFLHFLNLIFGGKWFLQLCPKLPNFVEKPQGILGVNSLQRGKYTAPQPSTAWRVSKSKAKERTGRATLSIYFWHKRGRAPLH
jgi:hypothetical protein